MKNFDFGGVAARAIARLRSSRDMIELALRPPGARVTITRPAAESILDDLGVVARLVRAMAEGGRD